MSNVPAPDQELLDVAARLVGRETVDLLNVVRRANGELVVILATGQKFVFNPDQVAAELAKQIETTLRAQLAPAADAAAALAAPAKSRRAR